jgi:hypothetical protein
MKTFLVTWSGPQPGTHEFEAMSVAGAGAQWTHWVAYNSNAELINITSLRIEVKS